MQWGQGSRGQGWNRSHICRADSGLASAWIHCDDWQFREGISGLKPGRNTSTDTHTHTLISSSVLHNTVSDGSWGHNNAAFGICPVKVGQGGNRVSGRANGQTKKATKKRQKVCEGGGGAEKDWEREKEIQRKFFWTTDAHGLRQNAPRENITRIIAPVQ